VGIENRKEEMFLPDFNFGNLKSFNNFQRRDVTTILIGLNNSKNLLHFVMKGKKKRM
jgi:hypothetical protein